MTTTACEQAHELIRAYWYLVSRNPLWLAGLLPGVDPRSMTPRDALRCAVHYISQERQIA